MSPTTTFERPVTPDLGSNEIAGADLSEFAQDWVYNVATVAPEFRQVFEELSAKEREYGDLVARIEHREQEIKNATEAEAKRLERHTKCDLKRAEELSREKLRLATEGLERLTQHISQIDKSLHGCSFDTDGVPSLEMFNRSVPTVPKRKRRAICALKRKRARPIGSLSPLPALEETGSVGDERAEDDVEDELEVEVEGREEEEEDKEDEVYCVCRGASEGIMIACDRAGCPLEWFHLSCVGLVRAPQRNEEWVCPVCRGDMVIVKDE